MQEVKITNTKDEHVLTLAYIKAGFSVDLDKGDNKWPMVLTREDVATLAATLQTWLNLEYPGANG